MRILLVEDSRGIVDFLRPSLEAVPFAVDVAEDGETGSRLAQTNNYDLIILDNILPKKTGLTICREVRDSGQTAPILVLSVRSEAVTKIQLLNAGADDYLVKPFSFEELLARVRALLRRPNKLMGKENLMIGDLILDSKHYVVRRGCREIKLTRKEYLLFEYLLRHKGIVLSRGMIMEHVWNMTADPFSNTIESHITSLRKKMEREGKKLIHTVSGMGYKLDDELAPSSQD